MKCMDKERTESGITHNQANKGVIPLVIAVDGPAASGKGTLARKLAEHFGIPYLDTGKLYRAVGWKVLQAGKAPADIERAVVIAKTLQASDIHNPGLFSEQVGNAASIVSAIPEVREALLDFQRNFARQMRGGVLDGRDIGTVICPDATVKLFVTASLQARAKRRFNELRANKLDVTLEEVESNLRERDERDAKRQVAPLIPAENAWQVDTTTMGIDEVFQVVLSKIHNVINAIKKS